MCLSDGNVRKLVPMMMWQWILNSTRIQPKTWGLFGILPAVGGSEIRHTPVEVGSLPQHLQSFIHLRWCRISGISGINSSLVLFRVRWLRISCVVWRFRMFSFGGCINFGIYNLPKANSSPLQKQAQSQKESNLPTIINQQFLGAKMLVSGRVYMFNNHTRFGFGNAYDLLSLHIVVKEPVWHEHDWPQHVCFTFYGAYLDACRPLGAVSVQLQLHMGPSFRSIYTQYMAELSKCNAFLIPCLLDSLVFFMGTTWHFSALFCSPRVDTATMPSS